MSGPAAALLGALPDDERARRAIARARPLAPQGTLVDVAPGAMRCRGLSARVGEQVEVLGQGGIVAAEVAAVRGAEAVLVPLGEVDGVGAGGAVRTSGRPASIGVGRGLLGRVVDAMGRPIDGLPPPAGLAPWPVDRRPPPPLERPRVSRPFPTGVRALDGFASLAEGQRVGLFAGPGAGKSTLLGRLARSSSADACVVALVGERGREVREVVEGVLGGEGLARSVVVVATSDEPAAVRARAARTATAVAEWLARVDGRRVLLLVDSLTRYARAVREVGLAAGEPPVRQGFPARVWADLPRLLERAGPGPGGSITAVYTVLAGSDGDDPVSEEIQGLLDGHLVLDRRIAEGGRHPALDVCASLSRAMGAVTTPAHREAAARLRGLVARVDRARDLLAAGAWQPGADLALDEALARMPAVERFLRQEGEEPTAWEDTVGALQSIASGEDG